MGIEWNVVPTCHHSQLGMVIRGILLPSKTLKNAAKRLLTPPTLRSHFGFVCYLNFMYNTWFESPHDIDGDYANIYIYIYI